MKTNDDAFQIIHDAVTAQAQGRLTTDDARRLEQLVLTDPSARRLYVEYVRQTASLRWWATTHAAPLSPPTGDHVDLDSDAAAAAADVPSMNETMVMPSVRVQDARAGADDDGDSALALPPVPMRIAEAPRVPVARWAMAAAILLCVGLAATIALWPRRAPTQIVATTRPAVILPTRTLPVVATLTAAADAQWEAETGQFPAVGEPLTSGGLFLRAGAARITFVGNAAELIVHAPSRFDLESPTRVRLFEGQVTAQVLDKRASGFTVITPSASVVDLGTQFGVRVDNTGATETQVLRGKVEVLPAAGEVSELPAGTAVRVDPAGNTATPVAYRPAEFLHSMTAIDLADVVAGGDGTQGTREAGVNAITGRRATAPPEFAEIAQRSDGRFHPCPELPLVAGVFIPAGGAPETIDPAGHTFTFPKTDRNTWYWIWAGGRIPIKDDPNGLTAFPTKIGDVDYGTPDHGALLMRTNKGITFDLGAMRAAHPARTFTRFRAACVNTSITTPTPNRPVSDKSDLRILVDGRLELAKTQIRRADPAFEISIEVPKDARYLTIVATDGGDGYHLDWLTLGDPRLE